MAEAMRAESNGALPAGVTGLSIDTRTIKPGEAYFAIKGDVHDGHAFVDAALKAGTGLAAHVVGDRQAALRQNCRREGDRDAILDLHEGRAAGDIEEGGAGGGADPTAQRAIR
eukprot:gene52696-71903_t